MDRKEALRLLNLPADATPKQIRCSYYELAKKYHPDHNRSHDAHDMFITIDRAYKFLVDGIAAPAPRPPLPKRSDASLACRYAETINILVSKWCADTKDIHCTLSELQTCCIANGISIEEFSPKSHRSIHRPKAKLLEQLKKTPFYRELDQKTLSELEAMYTEQTGKTWRKTEIELIVALMTINKTISPQ